METVRYRIKHLLAKNGVKVQVHVDHGKLGLARYWLRLRFAGGFESLSVRFLEFELLHGSPPALLERTALCSRVCLQA